MAFDWNDALRPRRCDVNVRALTRRGGRSATGREQRVMSDAGFVDITYEIPVFAPYIARAYRALMARLRSGEEVLARVFDVNQPRGASNSLVVGSLAVEIAPRDTEIQITVTGSGVTPGAYIGIGVNRLHIITEVVSGGPTTFFNQLASNWDDRVPWSAGAAAATYVVKVMPPIRAGFGAGTTVKFDNITMRGILADVNDGELSLDVGRFGTATFTIRESI